MMSLSVTEEEHQNLTVKDSCYVGAKLEGEA
jgi:hypothetical protein